MEAQEYIKWYKIGSCTNYGTNILVREWKTRICTLGLFVWNLICFLHIRIKFQIYVSDLNFRFKFAYYLNLQNT